eukprot:TRINITY_DN5962_c0_g1_i1.p2 TRINITY_DN5962_c0_g1~~TRINITY_DN5962_c0_g1_i1.p2  ORF type:complete len:131 (+),score=9.43 TRINITY_DN5962_c0_g1_i1:347-739(+)
MLRSVVGWSRQLNDTWRDTRQRVCLKLSRALEQFHIAPWSQQLKERQFNFASRIAVNENAWPARVIRWKPQQDTTNGFAAFRRQVRPKSRWDDQLCSFSAAQFPHYNCWLDAAAAGAEWTPKREQYVLQV